MTAADRAYEHTKKRILDGEYAQGRLLGEGEVSDAVGVSRTPVREAFLRLEAEGMLHLYPKRGALVVPISAADVEDVMETRLLIERFAIGRVIELDLEIEDELTEAITAQERHAEAGDAVAFVDADREFHRLFVVATGNAIVLRTHDSLRDQQNRMGLAALSAGSDRMKRILDQHREIVAAVRRRDAAEAEALIGRHLDETLRLLRRASTAHVPQSSSS
ncbi:MAG TPA: GntR family transcriptional regulator [Solirubrobacterales bacterium]|nr:GntR family transcriptional regulator [Solirubrobacterales bacterium]